MRNFIRFMRFFFGTPRRAVITIGVMAWATVIEQLFPGFLGDFVYRMVRSVTLPVLGAVLRLACELLGPFITPILTFAFVVWGFRMMIGKGRRRR